MFMEIPMIATAEYCLGWIMQLTPKGLYVYEATDTSRPKGIFCKTLGEAILHIKAENEKREEKRKLW